MFKKSIAIRRDGLYGLGNSGWKDFPENEDIQLAINKIYKNFGHNFENWSLIDDGFREPEDFNFKIDISIPLPNNLNKKTWENIKRYFKDNLGEEFGEEIDMLLKGKLSPIIFYEDYGLVLGEKQAKLASSLNIPVRSFILKRLENYQ